MFSYIHESDFSANQYAREIPGFFLQKPGHIYGRRLRRPKCAISKPTILPPRYQSNRWKSCTLIIWARSLVPCRVTHLYWWYLMFSPSFLGLSPYAKLPSLRLLKLSSTTFFLRLACVVSLFRIIDHNSKQNHYVWTSAMSQTFHICWEKVWPSTQIVTINRK